MIDREWALQCMRGPVMSVRTPFLENGGIDYPGLCRSIDAGIAGGSRCMMLTAGDSHYFCLSDDEIASVTKATVDHTAGRALVVAADRSHNTHQAIEIAERFKKQGADVVMCLPPDWGRSCTADTLAAHYAAVARVMPVMIVTNLFIPRGHAFAMQTITKAMAASENIIAVKDDMGGSFAQDMCSEFHERCAIIAGGQKRNHLNIHPYGQAGYLSAFVLFNPAVATAYWLAIQQNDLKTAANIVATKDAPFFNYAISATGGFDAVLHGMLELYGHAGRWRRKPYHSLTDNEMADLAKTLGHLQLLD